MRHEARRAPGCFFLELEQKVEGKRVSFSFSVLSFGLFQKRTLKERTDDVLERDRQQVALLDGELLVVDELRDLFLIEGEREEKRQGSFFSLLFFLYSLLPPSDKKGTVFSRFSRLTLVICVSFPSGLWRGFSVWKEWGEEG